MSDNEASGSIISASELRRITKKARARELDENEEIAKEEMVNDWFDWFFKRGERYLKDAAAKGYSQVTLDLPLQLSSTLDKKLFASILKDIRELVPGCEASAVEEEYVLKEVEGLENGAVVATGEKRGEVQTVYRIEVSW